MELNECLKQCKLFCNLKSNESSLFYICIFIGVFFLISIIVLALKIDENKKSFNQDEKVSMVSSFFRLGNNKPFMRFIWPWIIDVTVTSIFATMLPFFLIYIINPQNYCIKNGIDLTMDQCNANTWLGYGISLFFICCIISMFGWHYIVAAIGKKRSWELCNLIGTVSTCLLLLCNEGSTTLLMIFAVVNSIPAGSVYLNEVILTDLIDYDEFLTGKRNEGIYSVFSIFIPKIVSIFAQSIPLMCLSSKFLF